MQIVSFLHRIIASLVVSLAVQYLSTVSHKRQNFRKKFVVKIVCFIFCVTSKYFSFYEEMGEMLP